jgi:hypothetical protein
MLCSFISRKVQYKEKEAKREKPPYKRLTNKNQPGSNGSHYYSLNIFFVFLHRPHEMFLFPKNLCANIKYPDVRNFLLH